MAFDDDFLGKVIDSPRAFLSSRSAKRSSRLCCSSSRLVYVFVRLNCFGRTMHSSMDLPAVWESSWHEPSILFDGLVSQTFGKGDGIREKGSTPINSYGLLCVKIYNGCKIHLRVDGGQFEARALVHKESSVEELLWLLHHNLEVRIRWVDQGGQGITGSKRGVVGRHCALSSCVICPPSCEARAFKYVL